MSRSNGSGTYSSVFAWRMFLPANRYPPQRVEDARERACRRNMRSELDVELFQLVGLGLGGSDPFLHVRQRHDGLAISGAGGIELDVIGEEAGDDRRVHGIRHAGLFPEQIRTAA